MKKTIPTPLLTALLLAGGAAQAMAQDAGEALQGPAPARPLPVSPTALPRLPGAAPAQGGAAAGVPLVSLQSVEFEGNTLFTAETLRAQLGSLQDQRFDLQGLNALADRVVAYYRAQGYPFTRVVLRLRVIEGRYGKVKAEGTGPLAAGAQPFLDAQLQSGQPIESHRLERALLILDEQPGVRIEPLLRPGTQLGEGDLNVRVSRQQWATVDDGLDNIGNRNTGAYRARLGLSIDSPWRLGDRIALNALGTNEGMWLGSLDYETPLGASGLRGALGYAHTNYQLADVFASLDATGYADTTTLRLSYPLVRSQASNLVLSGSYAHKRLQDRFGATGVVQDKNSDAAVLGLQFDRRDRLGGGGVTYGNLSLVSGRLHLDGALRASDAATANTQGSFTKVNLEVARIQALGGTVSTYGRLSGQWARKNLDASEKLGLGGFYGVRAYPLGEALGDRGQLLQLELRYALGETTPFLLYDLGHMRTNVDAWDVNSGATRNLAGAGLGVRWLHAGWSLESTLAWRTRGGVPTAEAVDRNPRLFVKLDRRF